MPPFPLSPMRRPSALLVRGLLALGALLAAPATARAEGEQHLKRGNALRDEGQALLEQSYKENDPAKSKQAVEKFEAARAEFQQYAEYNNEKGEPLLQEINERVYAARKMSVMDKPATDDVANRAEDLASRLLNLARSFEEKYPGRKYDVVDKYVQVVRDYPYTAAGRDARARLEKLGVKVTKEGKPEPLDPPARPRRQSPGEPGARTPPTAGAPASPEAGDQAKPPAAAPSLPAGEGGRKPGGGGSQPRNKGPDPAPTVAPQASAGPRQPPGSAPAIPPTPTPGARVAQPSSTAASAPTAKQEPGDAPAARPRNEMDERVAQAMLKKVGDEFDAGDYADAADRAQRLLENYGDTAVVRRNRGEITALGEAARRGAAGEKVTRPPRSG